MRILLLLWFTTTLLTGQTQVQPSQIALSPLYRAEGDWCPGEIFTRTSPTTLVFTKDTSPQNTCFLHAGTISTAVSPTSNFNYSVQQWTQSATIEIKPGLAPFDDVVFFYWIALPSPTLHIVGHTANYFCNGCVVDPARPEDTFPAAAIIAGFYSVTGGAWDGVGHAILKHHQIYSDAATSVGYLPENGYYFFLEQPAVTAQLTKQMKLSNEAVQQLQTARVSLQAASEEAQKKINKKTAKGMQARLDEMDDILRHQVSTLQGQVERLLSQRQESVEMLHLQREGWEAQQQNVFPKEIPPETTPQPCQNNTWFRQGDLVYWCLSGMWVKTEVWK